MRRDAHRRKSEEPTARQRAQRDRHGFLWLLLFVAVSIPALATAATAASARFVSFPDPDGAPAAGVNALAGLRAGDDVHVAGSSPGCGRFVDSFCRTDGAYWKVSLGEGGYDETALPTDGYWVAGRGACVDGAVGFKVYPFRFGTPSPLRWLAGSVAVDSLWGRGSARAVTPDCAVAVGQGLVEVEYVPPFPLPIPAPVYRPVPMIWIDGTGEQLPAPDGVVATGATAISHTLPRTVAGTGADGSSGQMPVVWIDGAPTALTGLPTAGSCSPTAISPGGRFVIADCGFADGRLTPALYVDLGLPVELPPLRRPRASGDEAAAPPETRALGVSDGADAPDIVVGAEETSSGRSSGVIWVNRAGRWRAFSAREVLMANGIDLTDWKIEAVRFVASADGRTIGGDAIRRLPGSDGLGRRFHSGFVAELPEDFAVRSADVTRDGSIDRRDLAYARGCRAADVEIERPCRRADLDDDGKVGREDLLRIREQMAGE